jgi:hypothetical protein
MNIDKKKKTVSKPAMQRALLVPSVKSHSSKWPFLFTQWHLHFFWNPKRKPFIWKKYLCNGQVTMLDEDCKIQWFILKTLLKSSNYKIENSRSSTCLNFFLYFFFWVWEIYFLPGLYVNREGSITYVHFLKFIYSHVHTLFGSFLHPPPPPPPFLPLSSR